MELKGKVIKIGKLEEFSEKFSKVQVLVEQEGVKYDATVPLEFINKSIFDFANQLKEGSTYTFSINISGREWKDKHFVSLRCWKVNLEENTITEESQESEDFPF